MVDKPTCVQVAPENTLTKTAKPVFKYHRAEHPFHRLPFVGPRHDDGPGRKTFWAVPATGNYRLDCRAGETMANVFLKFIAETPESKHSGLLCHILSDMAGIWPEHPNRGHLIGFIAALEPWITMAVRLRGGRLTRVSQKELLDGLNRLFAMDQKELYGEINALLAGAGEEEGAQ